jgi:CDP-diacylglycerol--glycerol-3-phosphate 3-phosphatidyltransferase
MRDNQCSPAATAGRANAVNLPNSITMIRIFCIPILVWVMSTHLIVDHNGNRELLAAAIFIFASVTDGIDGYLARKRKEVSNMGILLDPMADKLLVAAGMIMLVQFNPSVIPPWIAVLILGREFLISGLRSVAATEGFAIAASDLGKLKMVLQVIVVVAAILAHHWMTWNFWGFVVGVELIARVSVWFMVFIALLSAADYFWGFWKQIAAASNGHQASPLSE